MWLLGDAGRSNESDPDTSVMVVIRTVLYRALAKDLQNYAFEDAVKWYGYKIVLKPRIVDSMPNGTTDASTLAAIVAKSLKEEVEKLSLIQA